MTNSLKKCYDCSMEENTLSINETIAKNLIYYRKAAGLTQAELAEKINYSDKSVSKWELGHGIPDVCVLIELANIYGVTLNDLVDDGTPKKNKNAKKGLHALVMSLASGIVWLVATCVFVALMFLQTSVAPWLVFVYAVPVNAIVTLVLSAVWKYKWTHFFSVSAIVWGGIVSLFLTLLIAMKSTGAEYGSLWMLFLLGVPLQVLEILWAFFRSSVFKLKPKKTEGKEEKTE